MWYTFYDILRSTVQTVYSVDLNCTVGYTNWQQGVNAACHMIQSLVVALIEDDVLCGLKGLSTHS